MRCGQFVTLLWPIEETAEIMRWYRDFIAKAPDDLYGFFAFLTVPPAAPFPEHLHNKKMCGIVWCYTGPIKKGEKVFKPIRSLKAPALDMVGPIPHPVLQSMHDGLYPPATNGTGRRISCVRCRTKPSRCM